MSGKYTIRPATLVDLAQIAKVARTTWDSTYNHTIAPENRREFLERAYTPENLTPSINVKDHWFYVANIDHVIVGFGHFLRRYHPSQNRAELVRLYVLPEHQNQRIGSLMVATGFDALAKAQIEHCSVSVQSSNHRARKFYERHGFTFRRTHGQFFGTQIITLVEYTRPITKADLQATPVY